VTHIAPGKPIKAFTFIWKRLAGGDWERYLLREQDDKSPDVVKLNPVQANVPVCMVCLSMDVVIVPSLKYKEGELVCKRCGARYGVLL
jgi:hypothetical protein